VSIEGVNVPLGTLVALSEAAGNVGGGVGGGDPNELANPSEITTLGSPPDFEVWFNKTRASLHTSMMKG